MLPGFRFLFAAIVLSMSILVFGLGAAALLRAAHEEFANLPSRRAPPEPVFARLNDDPMLRALALLRVDLPVAEKPLTMFAPPQPRRLLQISVAPLETAVEGKAGGTRRPAALSPKEPCQAKAPAPATEALRRSRATRRGPRPQLPMSSEGRRRSGKHRRPPLQASRAPAVPAPESAAPEGNAAATRIATLGGPAVIVDERTSATPDRSAVRKRALQRAREQRRIALARRARLAREAALTLQQQQPNPFAPAPATAPGAGAASPLHAVTAGLRSGRTGRDRRPVRRSPLRPRAVIERRFSTPRR